jgi:hypothetical protein
VSRVSGAPWGTAALARVAGRAAAAGAAGSPRAPMQARTTKADTADPKATERVGIEDSGDCGGAMRVGS